MAFSGNNGRSSSGDRGGEDVKRAEKWVNDRELDDLVDNRDVECRLTREVRGRMDEDWAGLKVLKCRRRGRKRRIMKVGNL